MPKKVSFLKSTITQAARLWANYIPGANLSSFSAHTIPVSKTGNPILDAGFSLGRERAQRLSRVTPEQINKFVELLSEEIIKNSLQRLDGDLPYLVFGDKSVYDTPEGITNALDGAGIQLNHFGLFSRTEMQIYANGHILFCNQVISTNPDEIHYDVHTPFLKEFQTAVITGRKFKLFEITYTPGDVFYSGFVNGAFELEAYKPTNQFHMDESKYARWVIEKEHKRFHDHLSEEKENTRYVKVPLKDFKGTEQELISMSNEEFRTILQDPEKIKAHLNDMAYLDYQPRKKLNDKWTDIGETTAELIDENYYQSKTDVMRFFFAPKSGTIVDPEYGLSLCLVRAGDVLLLDKLGKMRCVSDLQKEALEIRPCDEHGRNLSVSSADIFGISDIASSMISVVMRHNPMWQRASSTSDANAAQNSTKIDDSLVSNNGKF